MKLPSREAWMRGGCVVLGGAAAIGWNRYLSVKVQGSAYLPPAIAASVLVFNEKGTSTEKDIAAGALGYLATAQALSYTSQPSDQILRHNPATLQKVQDISGTVGAVLEALGKYRGASND